MGRTGHVDTHHEQALPSSPSDPDASRQFPARLIPSWPSWGPTLPQTSLWETIGDPFAPTRVPGAAETTQRPIRRIDDPMHALPWGQERLTLEGGGSMKSRIFAILSALAALFAVGGAGSRW